MICASPSSPGVKCAGTSDKYSGVDNVAQSHMGSVENDIGVRLSHRMCDCIVVINHFDNLEYERVTDVF